MVELQSEASFQPRTLVAIATPIPEVGGARIFQRVYMQLNDWRITVTGLKTVATTALKLCAI